MDVHERANSEILRPERRQERGRIAASLGDDAQTDRRSERKRAHVSAIAWPVACDSYAASMSARERRVFGAAHGGGPAGSRAGKKPHSKIRGGGARGARGVGGEGGAR